MMSMNEAQPSVLWLGMKEGKTPLPPTWHLVKAQPESFMIQDAVLNLPVLHSSYSGVQERVPRL